MGFLSRLKTGWRLAKDSVQVLRHEPSLTVFPVLSAIFGAIFLGLLWGGSALAGLIQSEVLLYAVVFVSYLVSTFLASFFNAALVHNAREVFSGRDPTLGEGLRAAWSHRTPLLVWSLVAATVGVILRAMESSDNPIARIGAMLFSVAWGILTYFIVPVIVFEDVGIREMFTRSGSVFRETWGETAGAGFGVGIITVLFVLVGLGVAAVAFLALGGSTVGIVGALVIGVLLVGAAVLVGTTIGAIAKTALYVYATEGKTPAEFENVDLSRTVS